MNKPEKAVCYFENGCNCSQAVSVAFCEDFGIDKTVMLSLSEGLGGGVGRMRNVCGAVCGMAMLASLAVPEHQPTDSKTRKDVYSLVQTMADEFKSEFGSIICSEILKTPDKSPTPSERTQHYYASRPCSACVATAAKIAEKYLLKSE